MDIFEGWERAHLSYKQCALFRHLNLLLSRVTRKIRWIMWLTLSCSHSSCLERKERLISATESSLSSTLSETEFSDSDWLSPESTAIQDTPWLKHTSKKHFLNLHTESSYTQTKHVVKRLQQPILTVLTWFRRRLLRFLSWCKLLGISHGAEKGSKWVAGDVLVVVALVSHLTGAQLIPLNIPAFRSNASKETYGITITVTSMKTELCQKGSCSLTTRENTNRIQYGLDGLLNWQLSFLISI